MDPPGRTFPVVLDEELTSYFTSRPTAATTTTDTPNNNNIIINNGELGLL